MRPPFLPVPPAFGLSLVLAVAVCGCSSDSASSPPSPADVEEQSFLQERIQKSFEKRPGKAARRPARR
jgi:hypothetical protein